jgi:hypothetical protein
VNKDQHEKHAADAKANPRGALDELARRDADNVSAATKFGGRRTAEASGQPVAHFLLGDTDVAAAGDEPYALPQPAPEQVAVEVAAQVATVRDAMSENVANLGSDGGAHFLLNVQGQELCGGCGQAFPCATWRAEIEMNNLVSSSGQPVPDEDKVQALVQLLGVTEERARQIVLSSTPLDEL